MFQDSYIKLNKKETASLIKDTENLFEGISFNLDNTVVMARDLPFYPGYRFLDISDNSNIPETRRFILQNDDETLVLDFTNTVFYELNERLPINLNKDTVYDYVRFFFQFVRGRYGRFLIVESVDDIAWREEPPAPARKAIGKLITPISSYPVPEESQGYHLQSQMIFKDSLFQSDIMVGNNGMVSLFNEKLLVEDLPVLDDVFGQ